MIGQVIATAALILCILAITDAKNLGAPRGMEPLCIGLVVMAIGVSMGFNCGYPINPARDLGPRLFTAVAGWGLDVFRYLPLYLVQSHTGWVCTGTSPPLPRPITNKLDLFRYRPCSPRPITTRHGV